MAGLLVGLLVLSCSPRVPIIVVPSNTGAHAHTVCDDRGQVVVVLYSHIPVPSRRYVIAHEMKHVEQVRSYHGSCYEFMVEYGSNLDFQIKIEGEAECASAELRIEDGFDRRSVLNEIRQIFIFYYHLDSEVVDDVLPCV
jgi:hypothetical protein